jgi:molybdopterin converting factor small subunit
MATVHVPALLRHLAGGAEALAVDIPAGRQVTVRQLLERLDATHAGLLEALLYEGDLLPSVAVFIDDEQALMGLQAKVGPDSDVRFLPPIVGGG